MSPEKQRIAIAEACGWKPELMLRCAKCDTCYEAELHKDYSAGVFCPECRKKGYLMVGVCHVEPIPGSEMPDYLNDLNAIAEAELRVFPDAYDRELSRVVFGGLHENFAWGPTARVTLATATAAQRAEAFLKTLNLWTNE